MISEFGYVPDPSKAVGEKPDLEFSKGLVPRLKTFHEGNIDFRRHCTDSTQKSLPSCVGNAVADSVEVLSSLQGFPKVELSRQFVWTLARNRTDRDADGKGDYDKKTGTSLRLAFEVTHHFGICLEKYWPYDESKWNVLPSLLAMRKATSRKIKGYYRITEESKDRPKAVLKALQGEHPVVFGTLVDQAFRKYRGKGVIGPPTGETIGGHALLCVGYDSQYGFLIKNSWGPNWGDGGYAYVSPEYMSGSGILDVWVPTMGHNFEI